MLVLLVGPKGSGKSHIGRILERNFGVLFFHVEPLWMSYYAECEAGGRQPSIPEGIAKVHPQIREALRAHQHVCVETTGASPEILNDLLSLEHPSNTFVVRVSAPLDVCLQRIDTREKTQQIPMDAESVRKVHALSVAATLQPGLTLDNAALSEDEIVSRFRNALTPSSNRSARC